MSKLLLIEPDKMLCHAFLVALFPEFQIQVVASIPDAAPIDFDALIVDAAALQEREPQSTRKIHALADWRLPIIWIGGDASAQSPKQDRSIRLNRPVSKETLRHALAQCLIAVAVPKPNQGLSADTRKTTRQPQRSKKKNQQPARADGDGVIELVDVVEEEAQDETVPQV